MVIMTEDQNGELRPLQVFASCTKILLTVQEIKCRCESSHIKLVGRLYAMCPPDVLESSRGVIRDDQQRSLFHKIKT